MSDPQFSCPRKGGNDRACDLIAAFLVMDIQRSPDWATELLGKIVEVKTGALPFWQRIGNAYRLHLSADGALIEDLFDPASAPQRVSLEELQAAVTAWIATIS
jgi:hypothetical protein